MACKVARRSLCGIAFDFMKFYERLFQSGVLPTEVRELYWRIANASSNVMSPSLLTSVIFSSADSSEASLQSRKDVSPEACLE